MGERTAHQQATRRQHVEGGTHLRPIHHVLLQVGRRPRPVDVSHRRLVILGQKGSRGGGASGRAGRGAAKQQLQRTVVPWRCGPCRARAPIAAQQALAQCQPVEVQGRVEEGREVGKRHFGEEGVQIVQPRQRGARVGGGYKRVWEHMYLSIKTYRKKAEKRGPGASPSSPASSVPSSQTFQFLRLRHKQLFEPLSRAGLDTAPHEPARERERLSLSLSIYLSIYLSICRALTPHSWGEHHRTQPHRTHGQVAALRLATDSSLASRLAQRCSRAISPHGARQ